MFFELKFKPGPPPHHLEKGGEHDYAHHQRGKRDPFSQMHLEWAVTDLPVPVATKLSHYPQRPVFDLTGDFAYYNEFPLPSVD